MTAEEVIKNYLSLADIKIGGNGRGDIQVNNPDFYSRVLSGGSLALGESYMVGMWDCNGIDQFIFKVLKSDIDKKFKGLRYEFLEFFKAKLMNMQSIGRSYQVGEKHYDVGNELYRGMLDKRMIYSCGYWLNVNTLAKSQEAKLDLICKKLRLKKGMRILDIGCGWGGFAKYASEKYGVDVMGITISKEQAKLAREICKGLPVSIILRDYRSLNEKFDRVVSIGMFEHVGYKNYRKYMEVVHRCLKSDGLFLLHTIGNSKTSVKTDPWINKYIFPNSMIPSPKQISIACENLFIIEDWHNFGLDYDKTLMAWHDNFVRNWGKISNKYDKEFYRMWVYYLLSCAGSFRARRNHLWQIVFSKEGNTNNYLSVR